MKSSGTIPTDSGNTINLLVFELREQSLDKMELLIWEGKAYLYYTVVSISR